MEAVKLKEKPIKPSCVKDKAMDSLRIGKIAGITD
jgi:hypothetical protein